jgi:hypothetical protein
MTNKSGATALAFGFIVFILSILPATAQTTCYWATRAACGPGEVATGETKVATGREEIEAWGAGTTVYRCCTKPVKKMGKGSTGTGEKPAAIRKAHCESQGPGYKYDPQTGACELKRMTKAKPQGAPEPAEEQSSSEQSSEEDEGYKHKKKHKKRHYDDDYD